MENDFYRIKKEELNYNKGLKQDLINYKKYLIYNNMDNFDENLESLMQKIDTRIQIIDKLLNYNSNCVLENGYLDKSYDEICNLLKGKYKELDFLIQTNNNIFSIQSEKEIYFHPERLKWSLIIFCLSYIIGAYPFMVFVPNVWVVIDAVTSLVISSIVHSDFKKRADEVTDEINNLKNSISNIDKEQLIEEILKLEYILGNYDNLQTKKEVEENKEYNKTLEESPFEIVDIATSSKVKKIGTKIK